MEKVCTYPIVFVHGLFGWGADEGIDKKLPYWGATTGSLTDFLNENGFETYSASVGPISSAWDRACELFARLTGTRVDYGKVHAKRAHHRRFGRAYNEPLFAHWGSEKKVHLIGHSFGGTTIRLLAHLLRCGDAEEREGTDPQSLSPLFAGGHEDWVQSVTTLCSPHNGSLLFSALDYYKMLPMTRAVVYNWAGIVGRSRAEGGMVDFHLEQYGMSDTPGKQDTYPLRRAKQQYMHNDDNTEHDIGPEGAQELNAHIEICPNIYYFSYAYNAVTQSDPEKRGKADEADFPFLRLTANLIMRYNSTKSRENERGLPNDGLVNLESALYPKNEPHRDFDPSCLQPGIWNVMPVQTGDHGTAIGLFADKDQTHRFYLDHLDILRETEGAAAAEQTAAG